MSSICPSMNRFFSEKIAHVQEDDAQAVRSVLMGLKIEVLDFNECLATVPDCRSPCSRGGHGCAFTMRRGTD